MNQTQQTFHDFIMQRVQPGNEAATEALLTQEFAKQDAGTFGREDMMSSFEQLKTLLKPDAVPDLQQAFEQMRQQMHADGQGGPGGPGDGHWHGHDGQGQPAPAGSAAPASPAASAPDGREVPSAA